MGTDGPRSIRVIRDQYSLAKFTAALDSILLSVAGRRSEHGNLFQIALSLRINCLGLKPLQRGTVSLMVAGARKKPRSTLVHPASWETDLVTAGDANMAAGGHAHRHG